MKADSEMFGLRTRRPGDRIALRGVRLRSRLSGMSQRTVVEQTFVNLESKAIEAVYTFPLPESAAVCGFEVITGDRVLTGAVEEIERAVEKYEDAIADGDAAFMVEENRPDVFTVRVGNLKPRQAATIRLTYVCALDRADNAIRVAFPTTIAPRYVSHAGTDPLSAMIDGDALNPPHVLSVPYGISVEVQVDLGRPIEAITSPSHRITVNPGRDMAGRYALVTLAGHGVSQMDRDVVLNVELEDEHEPVVQAATGPGGASYLAVTFVPEFDVDDLAAPPPVETVFVLDCSGSMQGESIAQATAALELCLRSLSVGDTFNICRFGSTFELMSSEPLHYCEDTLRQALKYIRRRADLGGTELYDALRAVVTPKPGVGVQRQVILLTDGQVSDEPACVELARKMRGRSRIFAFGIGSAASATLVKGLARATGGAAEFITPGERIEDKVLRTFGRLSSPMVHDVTIDWDGCDVQTLAELPPVFDGDVLTVFGRASGKLPRTVTLSCRTPAGPRQWTVGVPAAANDGGVVATMWARRTIQSLEEVNDLHQQRYAAGERPREAQKMVDLSKQFNLLSSFTTFIAVEHRTPEERNEGRPELRRVPVALAKGWGGTDVAALACPAPAKNIRRRAGGAAGAAGGFGLMHALFGKPSASFGRSRHDKAEARGAVRSTGAGAPPPPAPRMKSAHEADGELDLCRESEPADEMQQLLSAMTAEGTSGPTPAIDALLTAAGRDPSAWRRTIADSLPKPPPADAAAVVRTATVLLLLRDRFAAREPLWRRAAAKAVRYLENALGRSAADVRAWLKDLEAKLQSGAPAAP